MVSIYFISCKSSYEDENRTRLNVSCQLIMKQEYVVDRIVFF